VAKPDLGKKRNCLSCGARFYDLNREPIVCPKCETELDLAALTRASRAKPTPPKVEKPKAKPVKAADDGDDVTLEIDDDDDEFSDDDIALDDDDDDDDDLIEDTSELGEDKDDMFEVIDTVEEKTKGDDA